MNEEQIRRKSIIAAQAGRIRKMRLSREAVEVNMEEAARKLIEALEESYSPQKIARRIGWNVTFLRSMKKGVITCSHDTFLQLWELYKEAQKR